MKTKIFSQQRNEVTNRGRLICNLLCTLFLGCFVVQLLPAAPTNAPSAGTRSLITDTNGALAGPSTNLFQANSALLINALTNTFSKNNNGGATNLTVTGLHIDSASAFQVESALESVSRMMFFDYDGVDWLVKAFPGVTTNEVGYLAGVTGNIATNFAALQTAIDGNSNNITALSTNISKGLVFVEAANGSDATGARENPNLRFATIQAATDAAQQGDTVYVFPGTYQEQIVCATNVGYYFASGVVLTNVGTASLFVATNCDVNISGAGDLSSSEILFEGTNTIKNLSIQAHALRGHLTGDFNTIAHVDSFTGYFNAETIFENNFKFFGTQITLTGSGDLYGTFEMSGGSITGDFSVTTTYFLFQDTELTSGFLGQNTGLRGTYYVP